MKKKRTKIDKSERLQNCFIIHYTARTVERKKRRKIHSLHTIYCCKTFFFFVLEEHLCTVKKEIKKSVSASDKHCVCDVATSERLHITSFSS